MTARKRTTIVVWSATGSLLVYDLYCAMTDPDSTISSVVSDGARSWPIIATAFGILIGHLFFPLKGKR